MVMLPTRYYSNKQEKKVAKDLGGKQVTNSGASTFCVGDVKTDKLLVECKTCTKEQTSFSIKKEWLDKVRQESFSCVKSYSALAFNFGPGCPNYYVIDTNLMQVLLDTLNIREDL